MKIGLHAAAAALALGSPAFGQEVERQETGGQADVASQDGVAALLADLEEAERRDVFNTPAIELEVWQNLYERARTPDAGNGIRARTALGLSVAQFYAETYQASWESLDEAMALADVLGEGAAPWRYRAYSYASLVAGELGQAERSARLAEQAMEAALSVYGPDSAEAALAHNAMALVLWIARDAEGTRDAMCLAADLARKHLPASDYMIANNMFSCAVVMDLVDNDDDAVIAYLADASAFALANLPPDHPRMGFVLANHTEMMFRLGRLGEVEALSRRAIQLFTEAGLGDSFEIQTVYSLLAGALWRQGKLEEAEAVALELERSAIERVSLSSPDLLPNTQDMIGTIYTRLGRVADAERYHRAATRSYAERAPKDSARPFSHARLALVLLQQGKTDAARTQMKTAISLMEDTAYSNEVARANFAQMKAEFLLRTGDIDAAWAVAEPVAKARAERLLSFTAKRSELVSLGATLTSTMAETSLIALLRNDDEQAFRYAQLALLSELALADTQSGVRLTSGDAELAERLARLRTLERQSLAFQKAIGDADPANAAELEQLAQKEVANQAELVALREEIKTVWPEFAALLKPSLPTLSQAVAELGDGEVLVLPLALSDRMVTILIDREGLHWAQTPVPSREVVADIRALRRAFERPASSEEFFPTAPARRLHDALFPAELAVVYQRAERIVMPASGLFATTPVGSLLTREFDPATHPRDWPWLLAEKGVRVRVGATGPTATHNPPDRAQRFLGIGDPVLAKAVPGDGITDLFRGTPDAKALAELPALPASRAELRNIAAALGSDESELLTGLQATEEAVVQSQLGNYDIVVFATHGLVSGELNGLIEPALVLTPVEGAGTGNDGLLTASEIASLDIPVDWVILSACNTGAGDSSASPSYSGLARAFRQAGVRSLLLSHWYVRDDIAPRLTVATVRNAATGMDRAEALRQAQLELMADPDLPGAAHPSLWASFVLIDG